MFSDAHIMPLYVDINGSVHDIMFCNLINKYINNNKHTYGNNKFLLNCTTFYYDRVWKIYNVHTTHFRKYVGTFN